MTHSEENTRLIRVVIVEDNRYIREGWTTILDADPEICVKSSYRD